MQLDLIGGWFIVPMQVAYAIVSIYSILVCWCVCVALQFTSRTLAGFGVTVLSFFHALTEHVGVGANKCWKTVTFTEIAATQERKNIQEMVCTTIEPMEAEGERIFCACPATERHGWENAFHPITVVAVCIAKMLS